MSVILHDPDSRAPDRFRYAPWNPQNTRRFDRAVAQGWAWGGSMDDRNTRARRSWPPRSSGSIGPSGRLGRSGPAAVRLAHDDVPHPAGDQHPDAGHELNNALGFANALMAVDLLNWTSEGSSAEPTTRSSGGPLRSRASTRLRARRCRSPGRESLPTLTCTSTTAAAASILPTRILEQSVRLEPHGRRRRATHQEPAAGVTNFAYVRIKNRGTKTAQNVRVRGFTASQQEGRSGRTTFSPSPRQNWLPVRWPPAAPRRRSSGHSPGSPPRMPRGRTASY